MIYYIYSNKDTTIYEEFPEKNTGLDEILELSKTFLSSNRIYTSRILIDFQLSQSIAQLQQNNIIPTSSYTCSLKLYEVNAINQPISYKIDVFPISESWTMGQGKFNYYPEITNGASWQYRTNSLTWNVSSSYSSSYFTNVGGANWFNISCSQTFNYTPERKDLNINIMPILQKWLSGSIIENGFLIKMSSNTEYNTDVYDTLQYFSNETNTIYCPRICVEWDDSIFITGSLTPLTTDRYTVLAKNLSKTYDQNSIDKIRLITRPLFPVRTFATGSSYNVVNYLPSSTFYQVEDYYTSEALIPYGNSTKISCDGISNYFNFNFSVLQKNRMYRFTYKVILNGITKYFKSDEIFTVI